MIIEDERQWTSFYLAFIDVLYWLFTSISNDIARAEERRRERRRKKRTSSHAIRWEQVQLENLPSLSLVWCQFDRKKTRHSRNDKFIVNEIANMSSRFPFYIIYDSLTHLFVCSTEEKKPTRTSNRINNRKKETFYRISSEWRNIDLLLIVVFSSDLDLVRLISSVCFFFF